MPRAAIHSPDSILDSARALVLDSGPRAAGVAAIARASGAPVGSIYHRFRSRDGLLIALWIRTIERFQAAWIAPLADQADAVEAGAAMAAAAVGFARTHPDDTRLLLAVRPRDLLDSEEQLGDQLAERNRAAARALRDLTKRLTGATTPAAIDRVALAVVDLPHGALRRHGGRPPRRLEQEVRNAARELLARAEAD